MKLFVTIPAYNEEQTIASVIREIPRQIDGIDEVRVLVLDDGSKDKTKEIALTAGADFVISHRENKGLATTFKDAIEEALQRGADIIVNTDADNHYNQSKIPELVKPIINGEADIVIGGREIEKIKSMPWPNKYGNLLGSWFVCKLANLPKLDVSSGFRAYTREAALKIHILSSHTYTHESLIQAKDHHLTIKEIPIPARKVQRKSRLIKSIPKHVAKSMTVIFRVFTIYKPMRVFLGIGITVFIAGLMPLIRFLFFYFAGQGQGHIQSLIIGSMVVLIGFMICVIALLASAIGWNRKILEEILYKLKENEIKKGK